jgi:hypothetical protein
MTCTAKNVINLPSELFQLREADRLVKQWGKIQRIKDAEQRVVALVNWRRSMEKHLTAFEPNAPLMGE